MSNFLDFVNAQSKNMHHTTWLAASRNLHSNVSTSQIRTVTLQQERADRVLLYN